MYQHSYETTIALYFNNTSQIILQVNSPNKCLLPLQAYTNTKDEGQGTRHAVIT